MLNTTFGENFNNTLDGYYIVDECGFCKVTNKFLDELNNGLWNNKPVPPIPDNAKYLSSLFRGCKAKCIDLSLSTFNNIIKLDHMFQECKKLKKVIIGSKNTSNIEDTSYMFFGCKNLIEVDLENILTNNLNCIHNMFNGCEFLYIINTYVFSDTNKADFKLSLLKYSNEFDISNIQKLSDTLINIIGNEDYDYKLNHSKAINKLDTLIDNEKITYLQNLFFNFKNYNNIVDFSTLKGKILKYIIGLEEGSDMIFFICEDNFIYVLYHEQECCENVWLEDIDCPDINDLLGSELLQAECVSGSCDWDNDKDSFIGWTFYKLATVKGYNTLRFCDSSNGCYSTDMLLFKL